MPDRQHGNSTGADLIDTGVRRLPGPVIALDAGGAARGNTARRCGDGSRTSRPSGPCSNPAQTSMRQEGDGATALHWAVECGFDRAGAAAARCRRHRLRRRTISASRRCTSPPRTVMSRSSPCSSASARSKCRRRRRCHAVDGGGAERQGRGRALLLAHGADVNAPSASRRQTALMWAVSRQTS